MGAYKQWKRVWKMWDGNKCKWNKVWSGGMGEKKYTEMVWSYWEDEGWWVYEKKRKEVKSRVLVGEESHFEDGWIG